MTGTVEDPPMMNSSGDPDLAAGGGQAIVQTYMTPVMCGTNDVHASSVNVAPSDLSVATGEVDNLTDHMTLLELGADHGILSAIEMARGNVVTTAQLGADIAAAGATHIANFDVVTTTTTDGNLVLSRVSDGLKNVQVLTKLEGLELAANPIVGGAGNTYTVPSIGADGDLHVATLGPDFVPHSSWHLSDPLGFQGVAAANYGPSAMIAWSTGDRCNLQFAGSEQSPTQGSHLTVPCPSPQLAVDQHGTATVAYMAPNGVMVVQAPNQIFGTEQLVGGGGRDPHLAFDGEHVWLSYIDYRNQLVIGFFDGTHFSNTTLYAMQTESTAFRMTPYNNGVMLLGATHEGVTTTNMCKAKP